jgi:hypothetical protein
MTLNATAISAIMSGLYTKLVMRRNRMASNVDPIVAQIQTDFQALLTFVTGPESTTLTAATIELRLFRQLLALGAALLRAFFATRAAVRPPAPDGASDTSTATPAPAE